MIKLYYKIWVSLIERITSISSNRDSWKFFCVFYMSLLQSINFMTIIMLSRNTIMDLTFYDLNVRFFNLEVINNITNWFILFSLPFFVLNYIFILHNERYKYLIKKYGPQGINKFLSYFVITFLAFIFPVLINN